MPPCGFVAGLYAKTDANRGVWKAPAGTEAALTGVTGLNVVLTDAENGVLNPKAVNCLRTFQVYGIVIWGARTLQGNDQVGSEWKYVPVRRTRAVPGVSPLPALNGWYSSRTTSRCGRRSG